MSDAQVVFLNLAGLPLSEGEKPTRFTFRCVRKPKQNCANLLIANSGHGIKRDPQNANGGRAQWDFNGNLERPTFTPSINCENDCGWHGYIRAGRCVEPDGTESK